MNEPVKLRKSTMGSATRSAIKHPKENYEKYFDVRYTPTLPKSHPQNTGSIRIRTYIK